MGSVTSKSPMPLPVRDDVSQGPYILHTTTGGGERSLSHLTSGVAHDARARRTDREQEPSGASYALACLRLARIASRAPVVGDCWAARSAEASARADLLYA